LTIAFFIKTPEKTTISQPQTNQKPTPNQSQTNPKPIPNQSQTNQKQTRPQITQKRAPFANRTMLFFVPGEVRQHLWKISLKSVILKNKAI
jgi:hypothetical protein